MVMTVRSVIGRVRGQGARTAGGRTVLGKGESPASGVSAVSLNVMAVNPTSASSCMELWPDGSSRPSPGSVINCHSGQTLRGRALSHYKISYNGFGDDCTDFASRVLFHGGGFRKKCNAAGFRYEFGRHHPGQRLYGRSKTP